MKPHTFPLKWAASSDVPAYSEVRAPWGVSDMVGTYIRSDQCCVVMWGYGGEKTHKDEVVFEPSCMTLEVGANVS